MDVVDQLVALTTKLRSQQEEMEALRAERDALVRQLRSAGWSFGKIAKAGGLTRARVQQIVS